MRLIVGLLAIDRQVLPLEPQEAQFELEHDGVIRNQYTIRFPRATESGMAAFFGLVVPAAGRGAALPLDSRATFHGGDEVSFAPGAVQLDVFGENMEFVRGLLPRTPVRPEVLSDGPRRLPANFTRLLGR